MTPTPSQQMRIRPGRLDECSQLSHLCIRSKAVWGYDAAFLNACRDELAITSQTFAHSLVQVVEKAEEIIGVAELKIEAETAILEKMFVDPTRLRSGAGRLLFDWAHAEAATHGAVSLLIQADPDAAGFYRRMGAIDDGVAESLSISGRVIPKLRLLL